MILAFTSRSLFSLVEQQYSQLKDTLSGFAFQFLVQVSRPILILLLFLIEPARVAEKFPDFCINIKQQVTVVFHYTDHHYLLFPTVPRNVVLHVSHQLTNTSTLTRGFNFVPNP